MPKALLLLHSLVSTIL